MLVPRSATGTFYFWAKNHYWEVNADPTTQLRTYEVEEDWVTRKDNDLKECTWPCRQCAYGWTLVAPLPRAHEALGP